MAGLLETFQAFSGIIVVCPCCGKLMRLAELSLRYTGKFERTFLDSLRQRDREFRKKEDALERREDRFRSKEAELRDEAVARGRRKVKRLIRKMDPSMSTLRYDPNDFKVTAYPVDLLVFDGLNGEERIKNIVFIARRGGRNVRTIRRSIEKALSNGDYVWETVRVALDGSIEVVNK